MAERNRSSEPSNDAEIRAMMAIRRVLEPLDRNACDRVLSWASDRYVRENIAIDPAAVSKFMEAINEAARKMGDIRPLDIVVAAEEIARVRAEQKRRDGVEDAAA